MESPSISFVPTVDVAVCAGQSDVEEDAVCVTGILIEYFFSRTGDGDRHYLGVDSRFQDAL